MVRYENRSGDFCEVRGNSVHELPTNSFLPGTVVGDLTKGHLKQLAPKISPDKDIHILIESFGAIDQDGFNDFSDEGSRIKGVYYLSSREYVYPKTRVSFGMRY